MSFSKSSPVDSNSVVSFQAPRRSRSCLSRLKRTTKAISSCWKGPVVGYTASSTVDAIITAAYSDFHENDTYKTQHTFAFSSEGRVTIEESRTTGKLFICKHTTPIRVKNKLEGWPHNGKGYRCSNEGRILGKHIKPHPNIVKMLDVVADPVEPGRYRLWLEYCDGGDLLDQLNWWNRRKSKAAVPEVFLLHIFVELAEGLAFLRHGLRYCGKGKYTCDAWHEPIVHGDIKLENIFLRWGADSIGGMPTLVIGDFGVAKVAGENTRVGIGTRHYHAPEDVAIVRRYSLRPDHPAEQALRIMTHSRKTPSDVYAFSQILYEIAAGNRDTLPVGTDPSKLTISSTYTTRGLKRAILPCLAVKPDRRAEMSFRYPLGLLPAVQQMRKARAAELEVKGPITGTNGFIHATKPQRRLCQLLLDKKY